MSDGTADCPVCQRPLASGRVVLVPFGRDEGHPRAKITVHGRCAEPALAVPATDFTTVDIDRPKTADEARRDRILIAIEDVCSESPSDPAADANGTWRSQVTLDGESVSGYGPTESACALWLLAEVAGHLARKASR